MLNDDFASGAKERAIVYIDALNLYYGMRAAFAGRYKWLDLQRLSMAILHSNAELVEVKYFTARVKGDGELQLRQKIYLSALEAHCDQLTILEGKFSRRPKVCGHCREELGHEEKQTDVKIGCHIVRDAYLNLFDCCYLVSGDSDLVPPLEFIREYHPEKRAIVAYPPSRRSDDLRDTVSGRVLSINRQMVSNSQLPDTVIADGESLTRPPAWG